MPALGLGARAVSGLGLENTPLCTCVPALGLGALDSAWRRLGGNWGVLPYALPENTLGHAFETRDTHCRDRARFGAHKTQGQPIANISDRSARGAL